MNRNNFWRARWPFLFVFLILWAAFLLSSYFRRYPLPVRPASGIWGELFFLLFIILIAWALGRKALKYLRNEFSTFLEESVFSLGLGLGILAYLVLGLGLVGLFYHWVAYLLLALLGLSLFREIKDILKTVIEKSREFVQIEPGFFGLLSGGLLLITTLLYFVSALAPPVFFDSMVYHLAVPSIHIQHHRILPIPFNLYSNFPMTGEMLYTLALLLKGDILAKLINFIFGPLILLAIFSFSSRYLNRKIALLAAVIFYTAPLVGMNSILTTVDLELTLFSALSIYALVSWFHSKKRNWLISAGIFSGLALGTKYTAILLVFILLGLGILLKRILEDREKFPKVLKELVIFSLVALAVASPWYIKNIIYTGNPIYPFLYKIFGGSHWNDFNAQRWMTHLRSQGMRESTFWNYLRLPWLITMREGSFGWGSLGPLFLLSLPLILFTKGLNRVIKYLAIYCGIYFLFWTFSQQYLRSLLPCLVFLSIIAAYLLLRLASFRKHLFWLISLLLIVVFTSNLYHFVIGEASVFYPWPVALGLERREHYLARNLPYYEVIDYANHHLSSQAKILFIGQTRGYYCKRKFIANTVFNDTVIIDLIRDSGNIEKLLENLKELGITHILYDPLEARRLTQQYSYFNWRDERETEIYEDFRQNYLKQICTKNNVYLYRIRYESRED